MSHYFETPAGPVTTYEIDCHLAGRDVRLTSARGVFSGGGLDKGTAVLLRTVEAPRAGHVLDLGCGIGPIALSLALETPDVTVTAVDVNDLALSLTRTNADRLGVAGRVRAVRPEEVPDAETFDEIWSNPPIRIGKQALHDLLLTWLPRLRTGGSAYLVIARNLGADSAAAWLVEQGYEVERLGSGKGFRVLAVRKGHPGADNMTPRTLQ